MTATAVNEVEKELFVGHIQLLLNIYWKYGVLN